jgi:hypothetical protein
MRDYNEETIRVMVCLKEFLLVFFIYLFFNLLECFSNIILNICNSFECSAKIFACRCDYMCDHL